MRGARNFTAMNRARNYHAARHFIDRLRLPSMAQPAADDRKPRFHAQVLASILRAARAIMAV